MEEVTLKTNPIRQHGAAVALVQLLEEFGDLPSLAWRLSNHESLAGDLSGGGVFLDPRPVVAVWADALGVAVVETPFPYDDTTHVEFAVETVWRDVRVRIVLSCPLAALSESAVAA